MRKIFKCSLRSMTSVRIWKPKELSNDNLLVGGYMGLALTSDNSCFSLEKYGMSVKARVVSTPLKHDNLCHFTSGVSHPGWRLARTWLRQLPMRFSRPQKLFRRPRVGGVVGWVGWVFPCSGAGNVWENAQVKQSSLTALLASCLCPGHGVWQLGGKYENKL